MQYNRTQILYTLPNGHEVIFDSTEEFHYYRDVILPLEKEGKIKNVVIQPCFPILPPFTWQGEKYQGVVYTPDFGYVETDTGKKVCIEVKGIPTAEFMLRVKFWKYKYQNYDLKVMMYSKATGWREEHEYKKVRKQIKQESYKQRVLKEQAELKEKYHNICSRVSKYEDKGVENLNEKERGIYERAVAKKKEYEDELWNEQ